MLKQFFSNQTKRTKYITAALVVLIVAGIGTYILTSSHASTPYAAITADSGTLASGATKQTCSGASDGSCVVFGGGSTPPPGLLTWRPPPCGDATHTCQDVYLTNTGTHQYLFSGGTDSIDYRVHLPSVPLVGGISIGNGHNVIIIGGEIDLSTPCTTDTQECHGINISTATTGEIYIEGVLIKNPDPTYSQYTGDGIDANTDPTAKITMQNIRVEGIDGCGTNGFPAHADVFQPYGANGAVIHVDHLTGTSDFQGMEIDPDVTSPSSAIYENVNMDALSNPHYGCSSVGGSYLWWLTKGATTCTTYPMTLTNDYAAETDGSLLHNAVWPDTTLTGPYSLPCPAHYSNGVATWPLLTQVSGGINNGLPPGGDFVPPGVAGINYLSPGYQ